MRESFGECTHAPWFFLKLLLKNEFELNKIHMTPLNIGKMLSRLSEELCLFLLACSTYDKVLTALSSEICLASAHIFKAALIRQTLQLVKAEKQSKRNSNKGTNTYCMRVTF